MDEADRRYGELLERVQDRVPQDLLLELDAVVGERLAEATRQSGYGAVLAARGEAVAALDAVNAAVARLERSMERAAQAENAFDGYTLPPPAPLG